MIIAEIVHLIHLICQIKTNKFLERLNSSPKIVLQNKTNTQLHFKIEL